MAWMASARTASARAMIASSSLSSPGIICQLKVLISANSACICSIISWTSCLEFAIEAFSSWISLWVVRTFSSSSISSFSKRLSHLVFSEISALASRVAFFWLRALHFELCQFSEKLENGVLLFFVELPSPLPERKEGGRLARV